MCVCMYVMYHKLNTRKLHIRQVDQQILNGSALLPIRYIFAVGRPPRRPDKWIDRFKYEFMNNSKYVWICRIPRDGVGIKKFP